METTADNRELFLKNGIKNTRQRNLIYDYLKHEQIPATAEQIYLKLKEEGTAINLSTVYRILDLFISRGLAVKSNTIDGNRTMFELCHSEHKHHLICVCCKKIVYVDNCPLEVFERTLEKKMSFDITGHKLEIFGFCQECKQKQEH